MTWPSQAHALDGRRPVLVPVLHLSLLADQISDLCNGRIFAANRARISVEALQKPARIPPVVNAPAGSRRQ